MANCKIETLKAAVQNDSLVKFGHVIIPANSANQFLGIGCNIAGVKLDCLDGNLWNQGFTEELGDSVVINNAAIFGNMTYVGVKANYRLEVENKYALRWLYPQTKITIKTEDFNAMTNLYYAKISLDGNLDDVAIVNNTLEELVVTDSNVSGDTAAFFSHFPKIQKLRMSRSNLTGLTISDIGCLTLLNELTWGQVSKAGTIESFVAKQRLNGRTTESTGITILYGYTSPNTTFNGSSLPNKDSISLTWTASTITLDGVTISA